MDATGNLFSSISSMIIALVLVFFACVCYYVLFYPSQITSGVQQAEVKTPEPEKYKNDCLHPCVRPDGRGGYWMVQSPLYGGKEEIENPILYHSNSFVTWDNGVVVHDTPLRGYNSDPYVYVEGEKVYVFWREFTTPACDSVGTNIAVFGSYSLDGKSFSEPKLFLLNSYPDRITDGFPSGDITMCETLIKHEGKYYFYCVDEDFSTYHCNGIAIWEGTSLESPDFRYVETIPIETKYSVGKWLQKRFFGRLYFIPKPTKQEVWHFDLFEYNEKLYMICGTKPDRNNILIASSSDWKHFKLRRKPLINNNCLENKIGYRQYYYKSTGFVEDGIFHLFFTAQDKVDGQKNVLYHSMTGANRLR